MYGWQGTILRVDLTTGEIKKEPLNKDMAIKYLGGGGLNARMLFDEVKKDTDPLGPDNVVIFGAGPLVGTLAPSSGRVTITAKAPLSGNFGDTNAGGHFGAEMKFAGYDHIIIKGKAKEPVYLWIDSDNVEIRSAKHLWGKDTWETDDLIKAELGDEHIKTARGRPCGGGRYPVCGNYRISLPWRLSRRRHGSSHGLQEPQGGSHQRQ